VGTTPLTQAHAGGAVHSGSRSFALRRAAPVPSPLRRYHRAPARPPRAGMMAGGYSTHSAPSEEVRAMALALKGDAEARLGTSFASFEPVAVSQQVVAGMNYHIKVRKKETGKTWCRDRGAACTRR
jgi:hypothetical protein